MRRLQLRLRSERGMALIMALGIMVVLGITATTVIEFSTSNQKNSSLSNTRQTAFQLAESGIANTLAFLNEPTNNALLPNVFCSSGSSVTYNQDGTVTVPAGCKKTNTYDGGTVTWWGVLDKTASTWTVSSVGTLRNPSGASQVAKTLKAQIVVTPTNTQPLNNPAWNYMFATHTGSQCDETLSNNVSGGARMYVLGNLCLSNNSGLNPSALIVNQNLHLDNNTAVGASTNMNTRIETYVGGGCAYGQGNYNYGNPASCPGDAQHVYGKKVVNGSWVAGVSTTPPVIATPTTNYSDWYKNALPGPTTGNGCATSSGSVPAFDSDTTMNGTNTLQNLTPANGQYQCRVGAPPTTYTTTLSSAITASQTTIAVAGTNGFPQVNNFTIVVGSERMLVTAGAGTTSWTVQRGTSGTTAAAASSGATVSYTSAPAGEITWNGTSTASGTYGPAKTLTVAGTIFFDGPVKFDNGGVLDQYNGQATIYVNGSVYFNELLCGGVSGSTCDASHWNPNTEMLTIVSDGNAGQANVSSGNSIQFANNSAFEGALYATNNVYFGNNSFSDGPIVGSQIILSNNVTTNNFAPVVTVPAGMPGNPEVYAQPNPPRLFTG